MKAISIHPEPVMDILLGKKKEEYRSWTTHHRGPLLICSTAIKTPGCISGYAVCIVDLTDVKKLADDSYAWIFENVRCIKPLNYVKLDVSTNGFQLVIRGKEFLIIKRQFLTVDHWYWDYTFIM